MSPASLLSTERGSAGQISATFAAALSAGDLATATACFARDACLLTPDATAIRGREHIRPLLRQLIATGAHAEVEQLSLLVAGDHALLTERWTMRFPPTAGRPYARASTGISVAHRLEGSWKLKIAAPWRR